MWRNPRMSEKVKDLLFSEIQKCEDCGTVDLCEYHSKEIQSLNDVGA